MSTFYFYFIPPETLNRYTVAFYIIILLVAVVVFLQWYTLTVAKEDMQDCFMQSMLALFAWDKNG